MLKNKLEKSDKQLGSANFRLSPTRIEVEQLKASLQNPQAGAIVCFEGIVRNHNEGKAVLSLEYEAYESLAENEAAKILNEARQNFSIFSAVCVHRTGLLDIGEAAVFVGVTSAHRDASFVACRYIIDEIKTRLPIWKKETYQDGSTGWVNCQHTHAESPPKLSDEAQGRHQEKTQPQALDESQTQSHNKSQPQSQNKAQESQKRAQAKLHENSSAGDTP